MISHNFRLDIFGRNPTAPDQEESDSNKGKLASLDLGSDRAQKPPMRPTTRQRRTRTFMLRQAESFAKRSVTGPGVSSRIAHEAKARARACMIVVLEPCFFDRIAAPCVVLDMCMCIAHLRGMSE